MTTNTSEVVAEYHGEHQIGRFTDGQRLLIVSCSKSERKPTAVRVYVDRESAEPERICELSSLDAPEAQGGPVSSWDRRWLERRELPVIWRTWIEYAAYRFWRNHVQDRRPHSHRAD